MCDCLKLTYKLTGEDAVTVEATTSGSLNGYNIWEVIINGTPYFVWHDASDNWCISPTSGSLVGLIATVKETTDECPLYEAPVWIVDGDVFEKFKTEEGLCGDKCHCINVIYQNDKMDDSAEFELIEEGQYNAHNYYTFTINGIDYVIWFDSGSLTWVLSRGFIPGAGAIDAYMENDSLCPFARDGKEWQYVEERPVILFDIIPCGKCRKKEDRIYREYKSIKLPVIFQEEDRGFFRCCCPFLVLASNTSDSWKNDITSAWIKLSDPSDTVTAILKKGCCSDAIYQPTAIEFINEPNAFYWTIPWKEVLASDGVGCYKIVISYNIAGIEQEFTWGVYDLKAYSIENALTTARVRAIFDSYQEIEAINFTGSQVEDTIRFFGFIGNRQPNTEIDNIIYQNREMKKVVRENLNSYEILTDPTCEEHIRKLTDLYLLSENQLFISDYNAHNHSYRYQDIPVIVENSPEITYFELSRAAALKCVVGDKFKNKRSFYK